MKNELIEKIAMLQDNLGIETLLYEIIVSMSSEELEKTLNWICRNYEIEVENE